MEIKPGDVVKMRSGGPPMTVRAVEGDKAYCEWFGKDGKPDSGEFDVPVLEVFKSAG